MHSRQSVSVVRTNWTLRFLLPQHLDGWLTDSHEGANLSHWNVNIPGWLYEYIHMPQQKDYFLSRECQPKERFLYKKHILGFIFLWYILELIWLKINIPSDPESNKGRKKTQHICFLIIMSTGSSFKIVLQSIMWLFFFKVKLLLLTRHDSNILWRILTVQIKNALVLVNEFYNLYAYPMSEATTKMTVNTLLLICHWRHQKHYTYIISISKDLSYKVIKNSTVFFYCWACGGKDELVK